MMKIEIDGHELLIPEGWKDIKLGDYENWSLQKPESRKDLVRYVADVCKIDVNILLESPTQLFDIVLNAIEFVFNQDFEPVKSISIKGVKYTIAMSDKLTLGEYVDVESVLASDSVYKLSEILAILCRPIDEGYNPDKVEDRTELFKNIACDKVMPLISFFLHKKIKSEEIMSHYSQAIGLADQFLRDTKTLAQSTDGTRRLPIWQRIRFYYLMKLLEKKLSKCSDSSFTNQTKAGLRMNNMNLKNR